MTEEFCLSDYFKCDCNCCIRRKEYVKKFIRLLINHIKTKSPNRIEAIEFIDKLARDKLIK